MPPGFRWYDLVILGIVALVFFAPKRLPQLGASIGKTIKEFRKSMKSEAPSQTLVADATLPPASQPNAALPLTQPAAPQPAAAEATSTER
jgi:sec-independent protein translocase protein TatA